MLTNTVVVSLVLSLQSFAVAFLIWKFTQSRKKFHAELAEVVTAREAILQKVYHHSLHLRQQEEKFKTLERDRLAPIAANLQAVHADQQELLNFVARVIVDDAHGTRFSKRAK